MQLQKEVSVPNPSIISLYRYPDGIAEKPATLLVGLLFPGVHSLLEYAHPEFDANDLAIQSEQLLH